MTSKAKGEQPEQDQFNPYNDFFRALVARFGEPVFNSWMSDIRVETAAEESVTLSTASLIRQKTLDERYKLDLRDEWRRHIGPTNKILILLRSRDQLSRSAARVDAVRPARRPGGWGETTRIDGPAADPVAGADVAGRAFLLAELTAPLDRTQTFETYAVHDSNAMAHAAVRQILNSDANSDAVYIYGPSGLGKSHLATAVGHEWEKRFGPGRVAYLTHAGVTTCWSTAALRHATHDRHKEFLDYDLVVVDDVHLVRGRRTQQELANLISEFAARGKKILLTGSVTPKRLKEVGVQPRLADLLAGGLAVGVLKGDAALRRDVLRLRIGAEAPTCTISDEVVGFIAEHFEDTTRDAIGALNQILLLYRAEAVTVDLARAEALLRPRLAEDKRPGTMEDAARAAAEAFEISLEEFRARDQRRFVVNARHAFVYVARSVLKQSFLQIGAFLERDHTTIINSFRRAEDIMRRDAAYAAAIARISAAAMR